MKCVIQRVKYARVNINGTLYSSIDKGLLVLAGYNSSDDDKIIDYMADKIINLRVFPDNEGKLNLSVKDISGGILIVPNFTIYADASKGRRPDFINCAPSVISEPLFNKTVNFLMSRYDKVGCGVFQADMQIELLNDGPITIIVKREKNAD